MFPTCSMTSGAIQHGVPTNVFLSLFLVMSLPVAKKALTPKSIMCGGEEKKRKICKCKFMMLFNKNECVYEDSSVIQVMVKFTI